MRRTTAWLAVGWTGVVAVVGAGTPGSPLPAAAWSPSALPASVRAHPPSTPPPSQTRDPLRWPFARTSIWNTPLGTRARYVPARIAATGFGVDVDWLVVTRAADPAVPVYRPAASGADPCTGVARHQARRLERVPPGLRIPGSVPPGDGAGTPDGASAFLQPDGRTLVSYAGTARCTAGGPLYGQWSGETSLSGDGIAGGHRGSGMSSIGGSIRAGELTGTEPIRHALKLDVSARYLFYDSATGGRRWPARLADPAAQAAYTGTVEALRMGALLALPPYATAGRLGVRSPAGRKILAALRDYGAYVVDDAGRGAVDLCVEHAAAADFAKRTGHALGTDPGLRADMVRMVHALAVVDDNAPSSIGGHGARRAAWAPPLPARAPAASTAGAAAPAPAALASARVAGVAAPQVAPAAALWAVAAAAFGLLVLGLWSGRRLLTPARRR